MISRSCINGRTIRVLGRMERTIIRSPGRTYATISNPPPAISIVTDSYALSLNLTVRRTIWVTPGSGLSAERSVSEAVCLRSGLTMGCIDLFDFDARNRRAAIGMYIAPEWRGKGVGKQAVRLLEDYAFGFLNLRVLYAVIATNNKACSLIYEQASYIPSSPLRAWTLESDAVMWTKVNPSISQKS